MALVTLPATTPQAARELRCLSVSKLFRTLVRSRVALVRVPGFEAWKKQVSGSGSRGDLGIRNRGCVLLKPSLGSWPNIFITNSANLCRCGVQTRTSTGDSVDCEIQIRCVTNSSAGCCVVAQWNRVWSRKAPRLRAARGFKISRDSTLGKELGNEDEDDDDTDLCPVECVREFRSRNEFDEILQYAKKQDSLVVVDFFKTACGSCRYIEKGFVKLCKGAGNSDVSVMFLKHNVMDEYEEQSEVAEALKIKVVPLFHFYKDGKLLEYFATREKTKILAAICRHTGLQLEDMLIPPRL